MKFTFKNIAIAVIAIYLLSLVFNGTLEMFHNTYGLNTLIGGNYWWSPNKSIKTAHPYLNAPYPYGIEASEEAQGDLLLTNLYRKWHNIDNINRIGVLEHSHLKQPGGSEGTNRQFYIAEALDREAMKMQKLIRDDIAFRRQPYTTAFSDGIPSTPLGGNFYECHIGDCQWDLDNEGKILGIPSTVGTRHPYY